MDKTVVSGLLVNELVVNAYKYAFEGKENGKLSVEIKNLQDEIFLRIADNGPGLPDDFKKLQGEGLGSMLIQNFSDQLEAEMRVNSDEQGTEFSFRFSDSD
ncbi:sensor histidine kinase [Gracilimonas sp.]|uniref:sensor histidine kinase n=1 Tax=Gracilimonas sp. TaxID=1974203 RepID=UPI002870F00C|nr:sensor histidine kinase [Gracilimonas sp.]